MNVSRLVPDELWEAVAPLLPKEPPKPKGGRPRVPDRAALCGIVFALRTGCPWRLLPKELGCGSGTTCWRRLRDWQEAGVWQRLHERLLNWLGDEAAIDWSRASVDSLSVRAKRGARLPGRTRLTAASPAPSTIWWWIETVSPWPSTFRPPTPTMRRSCSPSLMPSPRSSDHEDDRVAPASVPANCTPTKPTTRPPCGVPSELVGSRHASPAAGSTPRSVWAATAGWSSARSLGCLAVVAWVHATSAGPIYSKASFTSPARCSASASSRQSTFDAQVRPASAYACSDLPCALSSGESGDGHLCPGPRYARGWMDVAAAGSPASGSRP
jgi:transposase